MVHIVFVGKAVAIDKLAIMRHKITTMYLLTHIPENSLILDIGIGSGSYWNPIRDKYKVHGLELLHSCELTRYVANIEEDDVIEGIPTRYKYVTMFEVIEHLENPIKALRNVRNLMVKGGILIGSTPNRFDPYLWLGAKMHPRHNYIFDKLSLHHLLRKCGFKVLKMESQVLPLKLSRKIFISIDLSKFFKMGRVLFWKVKKDS